MTELATVSAGFHDVTHHISSWANSVVDKGGAWPVVALIIAAAGLIAYGVVVLISKPGGELSSVVEPYRMQDRTQAAATPAGSNEVVTIPALQRAAQGLAALFEARGWRRSVDVKLVRAGLPIGVGEYALIAIIVGVIILAIGAIAGGLVGLLIGLVLAIVLPLALLEALAQERRRKFTAQLPDVLQVLAGTLRAGFSLGQGLDAVVNDVAAPMNKELRRALAGARLGLPIEDALSETAERLGSSDFDWTVMAIRVQREVGGNLAEILDTVAHTMVERSRLRREVRTLTAEGRISALILGAMPILLGLFIYVVNRAYIETLFNTTPGEIALVGGLVLEIFGAWWMYRTIQIEI